MKTEAAPTFIPTVSSPGIPMSTVFPERLVECPKRPLLSGIDALNKSLARDHAKTEVSNRISHLGLVEMTRARTGKTIESISFGKCPFCDGRGRVKLA